MKTQEQNKRKMLLILPLLVMPFLALAFYAMGGGRTASNAQPLQPGKLSTELPEASFKKETPMDKLTMYQMEARKEHNQRIEDQEAFKKLATLSPEQKKQDLTEQQINERLHRLQREIHSPEKRQPAAIMPSPVLPDASMAEATGRLEKLMGAISGNKEDDPEITQLNVLLDKIIEIQNPRQQALGDTSLHDNQFVAIRAEVARKQKVAHGASVELRLKDSLQVGAYTIPAGQLVFGTCRITNQRMLLDIKTIRLGASIIPVDLTIYDLDGMPGIFVPQANLSELGNNSAARALAGTSFYGMDTGIAGQLAGAGIDATKELLGKKLRKIKVKLERGQSILLKNNTNTKLASRL